MTTMALVDADRLTVVESYVQKTLPAEAGVTIARGNVVKEGANGKWDLAGTGEHAYGVAVGKSASGSGITAIRLGVLDGFDLSSEAFGAPMYNGASGIVVDTGDGADKIGHVTSGPSSLTGAAYSKLLFVDCTGR